MHWALQYQLFLFDFDGLLVDTERLHYQAYIQMCANRGFYLYWDFSRYSQAAHYHSTALRDQIYDEFPNLYALEPDWRILYKEKQSIFLELIAKENVSLLPGVADLLLFLYQENIKCCVVTNSSASLVECIRKQNPILDNIPFWITRENYSNPKPHSECYQIAINQFANPSDCIIGFEDSPRGLQALISTRAKPVLICPSHLTYVKDLLSTYPQVSHYQTIEAMTSRRKIGIEKMDANIEKN